MFSRSRIITYEADDAISIPNDALVKTAAGYQVLTVNKDGVAEARDVEIGYVATEATQITSGLNPGETVIVQRPPELKAGSKVKVIYSLTSMGCPVGPMIDEQIGEAARAVPGVEEVETELTWDPPWSPEKMSDDAKFILGFG